MQNANHVVVVMNGVTRWAEAHGFSIPDAQRESLAAARSVLAAAASAGVRYLTLQGDAAALPTCAPDGSDADFGAALANGLGLRAPDVHVTVSLDPSGRRDIARAVRDLARSVKSGRLNPDALDEALLRASLQSAHLPDPDLIIYAGCGPGEHRLSDGFIYEAAYAEFHFSAVLWPAFSAPDFLRAIADFAGRQRRFGKTAEQIQGERGDALGHLASAPAL